MNQRISGPTTWSVARLDEIFETITDGDHLPPPQVEAGVPFLVIGDVRTGRVDFSDVRFVSPNYYEALAEHRKPARGDLLYTVTGSLGIPVLVDTDRAFCVQRHIAMLKPAPLANVQYVLHALRTSDAFRQATQAATGTAQKTLGLASLRAMTVPVAPPQEQSRIVDAVDSYLSRLDAAVATLDAAQTKLKAYRASVLKAAVEGRLVPTEAALARAEKRAYEPASVLLKRVLAERRRRWEEAELAKLKTAGKSPKDDKWKAKYEEPRPPDTKGLPELPEGWCWTNVGYLADVSGGLTKNATRDLLPRRVPYLRVANVYANELRLDEIKEIGVSDDELARVTLQAGDLLVVEGNGSVDQIGRVAIWNGATAPMVHQNHLIKARFSGSPLERWALTWLLSPGGRRAIVEVASSTSGLHTLSISKVENLPIPMPPLVEQVRIIDEVDAASSIVAATGSLLEGDRRRCGRLRQSVLKWAFEGKLVDQDPNDEPADKLLARIRAERANSDTPKRARRARGAT